MENSRANEASQILLPLGQGMLWTLALSGWRYWNRSSQLQGATLGARLRRWWWNVNNWDVPGPSHEEKRTAQDIKDVRVSMDPSIWDFL